MSELIKGNSGDQFKVSFDDTGEEIVVTSVDTPSKKGVIELRLKSSPCGADCYYITYLSLDAIKRNGLGEQALRLHKKEFGRPLTAASPYTLELDDGSHLTGDGLPFIQKMREIGVVCWHPDELECEN